jgi:hypothetical protein
MTGIAAPAGGDPGGCAPAAAATALQVLTQFAQCAAAARPPEEDFFGAGFPSAASVNELGQTKGLHGHHALHRQINARPENVVRGFIESIQRELATDVTGLPW